MMRIYVAGPMSGVPLHNFPAFDAARDALRDAGHHVVSPADITRESGASCTTDGTSTPEQYAAFMRLDIQALLTVDAVAVLPDWERSRGARFEVHLARLIGLPVLHASDLTPVTTDVQTTCTDGGTAVTPQYPGIMPLNRAGWDRLWRASELSAAECLARVAQTTAARDRRTPP